jgi:hypothetical protein
MSTEGAITLPARGKSLAAADLMPMAAYGAARKALRSAISALKRNRRVEVGPLATFYFECYETMWMQVHEMLFIERGGAEQVLGELAAYNPLIPQGRELVATLMFEIADPVVRATTLARLGHVEDTVTLDVGGIAIAGTAADAETERTSADGKTSAVHFIRFPLSEAAVRRFTAPGTRVVLGFGHPNYGHLAVMPEAVRAALAADLDPL